MDGTDNMDAGEICLLAGAAPMRDRLFPIVVIAGESRKITGTFSVSLTALAVLLGGCATLRPPAIELPTRRPLGQDMAAYTAPPTAEAASASAQRPLEEPRGSITLPKTLSFALLHNPELAAFSYEVRAGEARALQAGLWPNPELDIEIENVGGTNGFSGAGAAETTVQLGQVIELAGKRAKRRRVALLEGALTGWDYEARRLDVLRQVTQAYVALLAAQRRVELATDLVELAEQTYTTVAERVKAGKDPPVEETKAQVALANAGIEQKQAARRLEAARKELAATWGGTQAGFDRATGDLEQVAPMPPADALRALLPQSPALARWETELEQRQAALALEKARAVPDPTVTGGYRRLSETDDDAFVLGLGIPLPITNRNQGAIQASKFNLARAYKQRQAAEAATYGAFASAYETLSAACAEVMDIRNVVLPGAQRAFEAARLGYQEGKFDFLTVLDSQRTLFDTRRRYLEALATYHSAKAAVESLIAQEINAAGAEQ
jgi:cobalt-zinc-cadmium efflux system outer membrane protein